MTTEQAETPKYAVVKWVDWEKIVGLAETVGKRADVEATRLVDAEVIRAQDITAGPIFHMYSAMILSYKDLLTTVEHDVDLQALLGAADHFHEAAVRAERWVTKKLPT